MDDDVFLEMVPTFYDSKGSWLPLKFLLFNKRNDAGEIYKVNNERKEREV